MSTISAKARPDKNDLVLGVVHKIAGHGVYVKLTEYDNLEAYCHIGEVAGAWIRNIRNFVRIDQQVVAKVLRTTNSGQIDISIKRVSAQQKKEKTLQYKNQMAALAISTLIAKKLNTTEREVRDIIEQKFIDEFGSLYHGFEYIATEDDNAIDEIIELNNDFKKALVEMVKASIKLQTYEKELTLGLRSFAYDGVDQIRKLLIDISDLLEKEEKIHFEIFSIGAPKYRIWLSGQFFEDLDEISENIKRYVEKYSSEIEDLEYNIIEKKA